MYTRKSCRTNVRHWGTCLSNPQHRHRSGSNFCVLKDLWKGFISISECFALMFILLMSELKQLWSKDFISQTFDIQNEVVSEWLSTQGKIELSSRCSELFASRLEPASLTFYQWSTSKLSQGWQKILLRINLILINWIIPVSKDLLNIVLG